LLPALDQLRDRGAPIPHYRNVISMPGGTLSVQELLPGHNEDNPPAMAIEQVFEFVQMKAGIGGVLPALGKYAWGDFVVHSLTVGEDGWCVHQSLRTVSSRSADLLERIEAIGAVADPEWFPSDGLVHLDLHTDNVLIAAGGTLTGVIDWDGACVGDHRFDMVAFAFDLDGHDQPVWEWVDELGFEPTILRSYVAHLALKCTDWAIRHHPHDVPRQLDRAERIFDRFEL